MPFGPEHLDTAGALLAGRYRARLAMESGLPDRFAQASVAREYLRNVVLGDGEGRGIAALRGGRLAGYLLATISMPAPDSLDAVYLPDRSARVTYGGVTAEDDDPDVIRALYRAAAPGWLAAGCRWHDVLLPSPEAAPQDAWRSLGFGREAMRGILDLGSARLPIARAPAGVTIRRAGPGDLDAVTRLVMGNNRHHAAAPVFLPLVPEASAIVRRDAERHLADPETAYWLAERDGAALALLRFQPSPVEGTMVTPPRSVYLAEAYTDPAARGTGASAALLAQTLRWAREAGYRACAVSWDTPNVEGARFWLGRGFRPVSVRLCRLLDPRVAWATPAR